MVEIRETKEEKEYYKYATQKEKMQIGSWTITIILLIMIFGVCSYVAYRVIHYEDMYGNDPLVYGAIVHNVTNCVCEDNQERIFLLDQKAITYRIVQNNKKFNPFELNGTD